MDGWLLVKGRVFWLLLMFYLLCSETEKGTDTMTDSEFGKASISEMVWINVERLIQHPGHQLIMVNNERYDPSHTIQTKNIYSSLLEP